MTARFIVGDALEVLRSLPDASVDLVLSSPPFLALRSYLPAEHASKAKEMGSEATPSAFLDVLLDVVEECGRVLAPHGTLAFELGDTYSGARGYGNEESQNPAYGERSTERWLEARVEKRFKKEDDGWPLSKSLCLVPQSFAWALAYGRNPWTGRTTEPWRVRNIVRWCRPNPPVGALGDKFRPATSEMVVACKARDRWFELDAVREASQDTRPQNQTGPKFEQPIESYRSNADGGYEHGRVRVNNPAGAPPLDWWEIPTQPYSGAHYATWPERLVVKPMLAMCPTFVCTECGQPRRRMTDVAYEPHGERHNENKGVRGWGVQDGEHAQHMEHGRATKHVETLGWSDCGHGSYRRGIVLDPFAGSGTTAAVAEGHGRDSILIDLDSRNAELAAGRVGMWLTVEHFETIEKDAG